MHVYVVGAGAVGTYLGDVLRATGATVTYAPRALDDVLPVAVDLAIVAVKAYDTPAAIATLRRALGAERGSQRFLVSHAVLRRQDRRRRSGADRIVSCALTVPVERDARGTVVAANRGGIALAPVGAVSQNWLVAAFERTPVPVKVASDYRALKWSKLALNIVANASCAILDVLPEQLVTYGAIFALEIRAIRETRAVMAALGLRAIDLPRYPVRALFAAAALPLPLARLALGRRIAGARGSKPPSLLLDVRAGKGRTENDVLNGAVAAAGRAAGVPTPVNAAFARILADVAASPEARAAYRSRPGDLLACVIAKRIAPSVSNA
ncbi:MAG: 2-dehydropantoate 2-reductase [Vulcanimicrobiaceae bacterium]